MSTPPPIDPATAGAAALPRGRGALAHPLPAGMRDLLPGEAGRKLELGRTALRSFERFGYELVGLPPFEYAEVLEHELGPLDPGQVLRFVEPETGEVVALRPDMTPQIARLVATRLADAPPPLRLCYEGTVVRRRVERARRDRQIHQVGFELIGQGGPSGDLEVLTVAASAVRSTGLTQFTLDLGHASVAGSLVALAHPDGRAPIVEALSAKDGDAVRRRAERAGVRGRNLAALAALPSLYGGRDVFARAEQALSGTRAEGPLRELVELHARVEAEGLAPSVVVDLGETWSFAYYTGLLFQILADGPGEPVGSGGRYDGLFDRFGGSRPAAGFAIDLGNLGWALDRSGALPDVPVRVLVTADPGRDTALAATLAELRRRGIACASGPASGPPLAYARAWRYTHHLHLSAEGRLVDVASGASRTLSGEPRDIVAAVSPAPQTLKNEGT